MQSLKTAQKNCQKIEGLLHQRLEKWARRAQQASTTISTLKPVHGKDLPIIRCPVSPALSADSISLSSASQSSPCPSVQRASDNSSLAIYGTSEETTAAGSACPLVQTASDNAALAISGTSGEMTAAGPACPLVKTATDHASLAISGTSGETTAASPLRVIELKLRLINSKLKN